MARPNFPPPPTVIKDLSAPQWKEWFAKLYDFLTLAGQVSHTSVSTATTLSTEEVVEVTAAVTITLPPAASNAGKSYIIKRNSSAGPVTIACSGSDTLDGVASVSLANLEAARVYSTGAKWLVI